MRNTPAAVVAVVVVAAGVAGGWAIFWLLGLPAVADRPGLTAVRQLPVRIAAAALAAAIVAVLVAWIFRPAPTLRRGIRNWATTTRRRTTQIPLFVSVAVAILVGIGLAAVGTRAVTGSYFKLETPATAVDVLEACLPAVAGAVIAVALVLLYRRQKDSERGQFAKRFGAASAQLGDSDVAVRVSGVYAMAAVADESSTFAHRQQCIDVLCGYLRLPYDPADGANHLSEFVSTTTWSATPPATNIEEQRRQAIRQNDREVRKSARFKCLRASFDSPAEWKNVEFDWDNPAADNAPAIPRCITPRPWPPNLPEGE